MENTNKDEIKKEHDKLKKEHVEIKKEYDKLKKEYEKLKRDHVEIKKEHEDLKYDYSENTIIQSMNDMKEKYDELVSKSIPIYRYDYLKKTHDDLKQKASAVMVLIDYLIMAIGKIESRFTIYDGSIDTEKLEYQLSVMKILLEGSLKNN